MPPVAPVAAMRAVASELVVQVTDVPGLLTRGRAKHDVPPAHASVENLPSTHCAKSDPTQASSPAVQGELAVRVANWAFSCCASFPFWRWKLPEEELDDDDEGEGDAAALTADLPMVEGFALVADFPIFALVADFPIFALVADFPIFALPDDFFMPDGFAFASMPEVEAALVLLELEAGGEAFCEPEPEAGTPGFWVISTNC